MKLKNLHHISLLIATGLVSTVALAQERNTATIAGTRILGPTSDYRTWSIGINSGVMNQSNIFGFNRDGFEHLGHHLGYSGYIKKQITPLFGIRAQYLGGKVESGRYEAGNQSIVEERYTTSIPWSAALSAEFLLGNTSWRFANGIIKPYFTIGVGAMNFESMTEELGVNTATIAHEPQTKLYVPADFGFKFAVAKGINLDLGYQLNWANQYFDAVPGGTFKNDLFSYAHAGIEIALGDGSKPYLGNSNPVATLARDYDDLKAERDALATTNRQLEASNQALKDQFNSLSDELKDDDGDGVANKYDKCPNTPQGVKVDGSGCPLPEMKYETKVIEKIVITEEDKKVVEEAINNLEFDLGKATIRPTSHTSLNQVAALLIEKNFSLKLAGHTDNTGSKELNLRLSKERAEAVKSYLVSKGANPSRIEAMGYGPDQPIASNNTAEGRQQNRRVEFTLY